MDDHTKASALGFGVVMFTQVASLVVKQIQSGRSGFSHLDKTVEVPMPKFELGSFMQVFHERLKGLGFQAADDGANFIQGGPDLSGLGSASHAKTKKLLTFQANDSGPDQVTATLTFRYLDIIVVDTGESAYRDALLDFVSGRADGMIAVPNDSLMAMNSLIGGAIACVVAVLLVVFNRLGYWPAIPIIGVTEFTVGVLAIFSISQKPTEITGRWKAVVGMILSLAAIASSLFFIIMTRSSAPA